MKQFCKRFMAHLLVIAMVICALPISMIAIKANAKTTASEIAKLSIYEGRQTGFLDGKAIYLQTEGMEEAPYDGSMNLIYEPVTNADGELEGGIYYHDTPVDVKLRKYGENSWFLDINYHGEYFRQLVKGECLTVKGKFQGRATSTDEYYVVDFEEVTFRYEGGTTWSEVFEPESDTDVIRLSDFNIGEQTITNASAISPTGAYTGSLENKHFQLKLSRTEESTGTTRIYYGDTGYGHWKNYGIDFTSTGITIRWWNHPTLGTIELGSHTLSKYGVDGTNELLVDLYLEKVDTDGDDVYDANLIVALNDILIDRDNVVEDMWDSITNHVLIYSGSNTYTTISNVTLDSDPKQITLSDFQIADGMMTNSTMNQYSDGIEGKEIVLDVTHTVDTDTAASNYYARMYVGTQGDGSGYFIGIRTDRTLIVFNSSGGLLSFVGLSDLGIANGDTFQLKLLFTWIDSDNDGNTDDANLDVYVNGTAVGAGSNIQTDATGKMNNYIRFYMNDGHTLKVESVQSKQSTSQISIDDFGIDNGTYGNAQTIVSGTSNVAIAGKNFQVEITPYTTTSNMSFSWIYYASKSEKSQTGFRIGIRDDGYIIIHNLTSIASAKGVAAGSMLCYPTLKSLGLAMGDTFMVEAFLDFVDYDEDGNKDDAYIRVKVESTIILEDHFVDAALNIGNALDIWCHAGNTVKLNQVLDVGEVANPFKFTGVDEDSYIDADGNAVIEVKPSIGIPGNPDVEGYENVAVYTGLPMLVGDATESASYAMTKTDHGTFKFTIPAAEVPSLPFEVTLQAGAIKNADETVELNLTSDYIVYANEYGISEDAYITCAGEDVALTYSSGDVNGIYLTATDSMTVTGWTGSVIYAADDKNSGFFLNGERHQEIYLKKTAEGTYYVALSDVELVPEVGDVAIVTGKWELDTVFVEFATIALKWNGTTWETLEANSLPQGQITLSDFGIDDGSIPHNQPKQYAAGLDGKEFVMDITHTYLGSSASSEWALLYYGTNYGGNGYCLALRADGYSQIKNEAFATSTTISGQDLRNYDVTPGESYRLSLKLTYIDADGDGAKDDANLDVFVQGNPINEGKNIIIDAKSGTMGDYIYLYASESKHTMTGKSIVGTMINGGNVSRNSADDEWLVDGANATVNGTSTEQGTVLYKPGDYVINSTIGDVTMSQTVSLYHPGDVNVDNTYDVADLVRVKKHQNQNTADTVAGQLAADNADLTDLRKTLIGKTKTDDALPTEIVGATTAGTYITSVDASENGTTVISMADSDNGYQAKKENFDDYGFDYVLDFNNDRAIKILQLTDTQTIDSSQARPGRFSEGDSQIELWAKGKSEELMISYIRETIEATNPDLILLTGDIVYGEFDDDGSCFKEIVECMDSFKIPWAPVYGNHDSESRMGVEWQNEQLAKSPYCLFNARHEIEGNGNYSIGISHNGTLERVIYMMDSNGVYVPWYEADLYKDTEAAQSADKTAVKKTQGFSMKQKNWYRTMALRTNDIAGKTIPSILGYHIGSIEYLEAAKAACYQSTDSSEVKYTIGINVEAQPGDSGYKGNAHLTREEPHLLDYMHEVGTDGTFIGHQHSINTSVYYDGIRWTYGVKTGEYCDYPSEMGGTLINLSPDSSTFEVERIIVNP